MAYITILMQISTAELKKSFSLLTSKKNPVYFSSGNAMPLRVQKTLGESYIDISNFFYQPYMVTDLKNT